MVIPLLFLFASAPAADFDKLVKDFVDVMKIVREQSADPVSTDNIVYQGAIPGMLRTLDPHSVFFDPGQYEQLKQMERSEQKGFGTVVSVLPGRVMVLQALPGTPSAKAGLAPGDEMLAINNVDLSRLDFDQLVQYLGMARQQQAAIVVRRPGNARLFNFTLNPAVMDAPSVERAFLLEPGVAYLRVASFDPQTGKLIKEAIEKFGGAGLKGLVLDFRNNPGGVVEAALETASYFLKPGQKILSVRGRKVNDKDVDTPKEASPYKFPVAILVNEKTASAAEIVTGALQDHDRAVVLGVPTYGKGLVQSVYPLAAETAMALTTSFYFTPSGRSIQKPLKDSQLQLTQQQGQYHTDAGRAVTGGGGIHPDVIVEPEAPSRLHAYLDATGTFSSFAIQYVEKNKPDAGFRVTGAVLDEFQTYCSEHQIQPGLSEWLRERPYIESRLNEEIQTQVAGVEKGDEVAAARDRVVQRALTEIGKLQPQ
jgi:carboxyl-terminal processing protease